MKDLPRMAVTDELSPVRVNIVSTNSASLTHGESLFYSKINSGVGAARRKHRQPSPQISGRSLRRRHSKVDKEQEAFLHIELAVSSSIHRRLRLSEIWQPNQARQETAVRPNLSTYPARSAQVITADHHGIPRRGEACRHGILARVHPTLRLVNRRPRSCKKVRRDCLVCKKERGNPKIEFWSPTVHQHWPVWSNWG